MNDHILTKECDSIARNIFEEIMENAAPDETPEDYRDDMMDRVHEWIDGHEFVIYYHKAIMTCAHCNTDQGEEFLEDTGMPKEPTFGGLACIIVYGEMCARVAESLNANLVESWERETA
jgi:hypothetical protein